MKWTFAIKKPSAPGIKVCCRISGKDDYWFPGTYLYLKDAYLDNNTNEEIPRIKIMWLEGTKETTALENDIPQYSYLIADLSGNSVEKIKNIGLFCLKKLIQGEVVFSPAIYVSGFWRYSKDMPKAFGVLPKKIHHWDEYWETFIQGAAKVYVIKHKGMDKSESVQFQVSIAREYEELPLEFIKIDDL